MFEQSEKKRMNAIHHSHKNIWQKTEDLTAWHLPFHCFTSGQRPHFHAFPRLYLQLFVEVNPPCDVDMSSTSFSLYLGKKVIFWPSWFILFLFWNKHEQKVTICLKKMCKIKTMQTLQPAIPGVIPVLITLDSCLSWGTHRWSEGFLCSSVIGADWSLTWRTVAELNRERNEAT